MRSSGDLFQIGATNSAGVYPKQEFAGANLGHGHRFQANVVDSSIHGGQHRGRNGPLSFVDRELSGNRHSLASYSRNWMQFHLGLVQILRAVCVLPQAIAQRPRRLLCIRSQPKHSRPKPWPHKTRIVDEHPLTDSTVSRRARAVLLPSPLFDAAGTGSPTQRARSMKRALL